MVIMGQMDLFSMPVGHRIEMYGDCGVSDGNGVLEAPGEYQTSAFRYRTQDLSFLRKIKKR